MILQTVTEIVLTVEWVRQITVFLSFCSCVYLRFFLRFKYNGLRSINWDMIACLWLRNGNWYTRVGTLIVATIYLQLIQN